MNPKILEYEGSKYKIGIYGYVYVLVDNEWLKTLSLTVEEFHKEELKQIRKAKEEKIRRKLMKKKAIKKKL